MKSDVMTRCAMLDGWFDDKSKKIDKTETVTNVEFVTGKKKSKNSLSSLWSKLWSSK